MGIAEYINPSTLYSLIKVNINDVDNILFNIKSLSPLAAYTSVIVTEKIRKYTIVMADWRYLEHLDRKTANMYKEILDRSQYASNKLVLYVEPVDA